MPSTLRQLAAAAAGSRRVALTSALLQRLQIDLNAPAVQRRVDAVDADERREALHRRVLQNHLRQRLLPLATSPQTKSSAALPRRPESRPYPEPGKSLRDHHVQKDRSRQRRHRHQQRQCADAAAPTAACVP